MLKASRRLSTWKDLYKRCYVLRVSPVNSYLLPGHCLYLIAEGSDSKEEKDNIALGPFEVLENNGNTTFSQPSDLFERVSRELIKQYPQLPPYNAFGA